MYAVIFTATINQLDQAYNDTAIKMRQLSYDKYNCSEFISTYEDGLEISISYWSDLTDIKNWKQDSAHLVAQQQGIEKWYTSYKIQITEIIREYSHTQEA